MPGSHEYHQPNAPNSFEDDPESDIDIDLQELGPSSRVGNGRPKDERLEGSVQDGHIPLQSMRAAPLRASGRRTRKQEENTESSNDGSVPERPGSRGGDSNEIYNVGDATPLLHSDDDPQQANSNSTSQRVSRRLRFPRFGSRRAGYVNIQDNESGDEAGTSSTPRNITIGQYPPPRFPANAISNAKYTPWSFLPRTLYNEFSFFINLYFLIVALSQLIPPLRIGVLWTYMVPLAFVLAVTLGKEAYDDVERRKRDAEANRELFTMLRLRDPQVEGRGKKDQNKRLKSEKRRRAGTTGQRRLDAIQEEEERVGAIQVEEINVKSKDIKVGDVLKLGKNDRVPADVVILRSYTSESSAVNPAPAQEMTTKEPDLLFEEDETSGHDTFPEATSMSSNPAMEKKPLPLADGGGVGECFIRTDQLDGETDWKLRIASPLTQFLEPAEFTRLTVVASKPSKKVNEFAGRLELQQPAAPPYPSSEGRGSQDQRSTTAPLSIDNTAWANTVLASNAIVLAVVVYTGAQTRQALSTAPSRSKKGLLELEINNLTKFLCILTVTLSGVLVCLQAYDKSLVRPWYVSLCRFLILFSSIIPISLRVNLDLGKTVYAYYIQHDKEMPEAVVRTSTIPEDLGRVEYLLSDKTGTLTQNGESEPKSERNTVKSAV